MGRIKNLLIEADDLGIVTTGRSPTEIAEDIENYHKLEALKSTRRANTNEFIFVFVGLLVILILALTVIPK